MITRQRADQDVDAAFGYYLVEGGPDLAVAFIDEFERSTSHLSRFPLSGSTHLAHALAIPGLRHWPLNRFPYLIIYMDTEFCVEIWRVLHGKTDIPAWINDDETT